VRCDETARPALDLLDGFGTETIDHFGRSLRDHLAGTERLLLGWCAPAHVCRAGLFHAIYGTATFPQASSESAQRRRIRELIGDRAEVLVHIFCTADRKRLLLDNLSPPYQWVDHRTGRVATLDADTLTELVMLEVANFLEQFAARPDLPPRTVHEMKSRFAAAQALLPDCAQRACRSAFPGWPDVGPSLASFAPFLIAANVRGLIDAGRLRVGPGRGHAGHVVLGELVPRDGKVLTVLDQERRPHAVDAPRRILAVLGPRDSSTHTCAILPPEGLDVHEGAEVRWVAGESGIVGQLEREAHADSIHCPELAPRFRCIGLLSEGNDVVDIRRFRVRPTTTTLSTPVVLVGATSTGAGKTVLASQLIRRLSDRGLAVGAIKVTGTGGVMDSLQHARAGAVATLDSVDAGLITTHGPAAPFHERIPDVFRRLQDHRVDVVVAELGGDLVSANNPELFALTEIMDNVRLMLVVCNDALGAAGVQRFAEARLGFPASKMIYLSSPFRNHAGMTRRMHSVGVPRVYDPRSDSDLAQLAELIASQITS